jgi:hypothetical protein
MLKLFTNKLLKRGKTCLSQSKQKVTSYQEITIAYMGQGLKKEMVLVEQNFRSKGGSDKVPII